MHTKAEFLSQIETHGPILVGLFLTGRIESGTRVNAEKNGIKEAFASVVSVILCGRKAFEVKTNLKAERLEAALKAVGDVTKETAFMPCEPNTPCYVAVSSIKNDKGKLGINGVVNPFAQSASVASKKA